MLQVMDCSTHLAKQELPDKVLTSLCGLQGVKISAFTSIYEKTKLEIKEVTHASQCAD